MDADLEGAVVSWLRGASVGELRTFLLYCGVDGSGLPADELYAVVESACVDCPGFVGSAFLRYRDPATGVPARAPDPVDGFDWAALEFERLPPTHERRRSPISTTPPTLCSNPPSTPLYYDIG